MSGRVIHFEIPADDVERAREFYQEAFGWRINPVPDMNYALISTTETDERGAPTEPGAINGGMMTRGGAFTAPVVTVETDDIDEALATVQKLGGAVAMPKMAVGDMGHSAYFTDTEGNVIGLWQTLR